MNTFDLQIQSTASDGTHTPSDIVQMAHAHAVHIIALTDHDTLDGVEEAGSRGKMDHVEVIPGIEISVEEYGLHILGYGVVRDGPVLGALLGESIRSREESARQMTENLQRAGFVVSWDEVRIQAQGKVIARPHLARAVLRRPENKEKLGGITTVHDFIRHYLHNDSPLYVRRPCVSAKDAIAALHASGGVAVWSHPALHFRANPDELEVVLHKLMEWGLEGIEVFNPSHTEDDVEYLEMISRKYALLRTGGSDFHEVATHAQDARGLHSANFIGDYETYGFPVEDIVARLKNAIATHSLV